MERQNRAGGAEAWLRAGACGIVKAVSHRIEGATPLPPRGMAAGQPFRPTHPLFQQAPPLLLGAGGMLHRAWATMLEHWDVRHRSLGRKDLDLNNPDAIA